MLCRATQDGLVMVESSDKCGPLEKRMADPSVFCFGNHLNSLKREEDKTLKDEFPRSVGAQYATGEEWRNSSRKNEEMEQKQKQHPVVNVTSLML